MKKLLFIFTILSVLMNNVFAQDDDPFVGTWNFELNKKIDYPSMLDSAKAFNYDVSTEKSRALLFSAITTVVIARCEDSELVISPFENTVMLKTKRLNDPTTEDSQWGKWFKLGEGKYLIEFRNRIEFYELNVSTGEFYLKKNPAFNLINELLKDNLKLVKKGN